MTVKKFRKKPVEVEAVQLIEDAYWPGIAAWCSGTLENVEQAGSGGHRTVLRIETLEGVMSATLGDWIIRGVKGEFYPCKPDVFEQSYESCDPEESA